MSAILVVRALSLRSVGVGVALAACLIMSWLAGLIVFTRHIPSVVADRDTHTDAIVILTGGSKRLATALQLLAEGMAERVFVSGVHPNVSIEQLVKMAPGPPARVACCVDAGYGALDTAGNATEAANWMRHHGYESMRLVTGSYHMPRSLMEFRYVMPKTTVIPHPVFPEDVKVDRWWEWPGTAALVVSEYNKLLVTWARHVFAPSGRS